MDERAQERIYEYAQRIGEIRGAINGIKLGLFDKDQAIERITEIAYRGEDGAGFSRHTATNDTREDH